MTDLDFYKNINNDDVLQLNYNVLPKYSLRNNLKMSLRHYYLINNDNESKKIYIGQINNLSYNLSDIIKGYDCNILTNISFVSQKPIDESSNYIITFSIVCNDIKLVKISNKSSEIHDLNILDYFETRFVDINNFTNDVFLTVEFAMFNNYSKLPVNIGIYCSAISISERYKIKKKVNEYSLIEHIRFYSSVNNIIEDQQSDRYETYKNKLMSYNSCHYNIIDENTTQLNIYRREAICPIIYFSFLWNDQYTIEYPKIKNITVIIDNKYIKEC